MPEELPEGMVRRFYFPPPATPNTDTFSNAEELSKYLATGADLGPLQGFVNALLKTLQGDLDAIPQWISEQTADWLDDFSVWFLNLGASFHDLMQVFEGVYDGDDVALLTIQSVLNTIKSLAGGMIDLSRLPSVPLGSLTLTQPNLLLNPEFDGSISMDGEGIWFWDEAMGRTSPGAARTTGDGTRKVLTSNVVQSGPDEDFETGVWVRWDSVTGTGELYRLVLSAYQGDLKLSDTVIGAITSPSASAGWTHLSGEYTTPANTDHVRFYLECTTNATGGQVWFDDAELRKTASSLPMEWIKDLLPQLSGLWDNLEALVNNALSALGIIGSGSLLDRILDLADEFGDMLGGIEDGAADFANLIDQLLHDPASLFGTLPQSLVDGLTAGLNTIRDQILSVIKNVIQGIRGVPFVGDNIADALLAMLGDVAGLQNTAITAKTTAVQAALDVVDLRAQLQAVSVTQQWVSLSTSDLASFPRVLLGLGMETGGKTTSSDSHSHSKGSLSANTSTGTISGSTGSNSHSHTVSRNNEMPSFNPGKGTAGFVPLVVDRFCRPRRLKLITGSVGWSLFDIDYWYVALYKYNPNDGRIYKIFDGGDQKGVISSAARLHAFDMGSGLANCVPGEILFAAQLQNSGLIVSTRPIAALWQPGLQDPSAELLVAPYYEKSGQSNLATSYALSELSANNDRLPWMGVGTEPTS